jgi:hypothetical protein
MVFKIVLDCFAVIPQWLLNQLQAYLVEIHHFSYKMYDTKGFVNCCTEINMHFVYGISQ